MTWAIITGVIIIISFVVILSPELRAFLHKSFINFLGLDSPNIIFQDLELDNMSTNSDKLGIEPGYYLEYGKMTAQKFIRFDDLHQVRFTLKNTNDFSNEPIVIKKIIVGVCNFVEKDFEPFYIIYDAGAGETEKIYEVDCAALSKMLTKSKTFEIEAKISKDNTESFDIIDLNGSKMQDYFKVKIPLQTRGILNFSIVVLGSYKGKVFKIKTVDYWIGNSRANNEKWYQK